jgi:hypothetical protein
MTEGTLKTLTRMTRTKLMEAAKDYPDIVGAHGMTKEQLIEVLSKAKRAAGEWVEEPEESIAPVKEEKIIHTKASLKAMIRDLKRKRDDLLAAGDRAAFIKARSRLSSLKGKLRRLPPVHHHTP